MLALFTRNLPFLDGCGRNPPLLHHIKIQTHAQVCAMGCPCTVRHEILCLAGLGPYFGRDDVSESASISSGIAARYATALFELAKESKGLKALEGDIDALDAALTSSADLKVLISSPVYTREDQARAISAIAVKMGISPLSANTLALMASKRRLFVLPHLTKIVQEKISEEKGEVTAEVISAVALSAAQAKDLAATLKASVGKEVKLKTAVDESLIGGLIVKLGSTMIDTSVKAKLAALQNAMKEVG
jgi:F-type H+-transporting ATPase subunit delta